LYDYLRQAILDGTLEVNERLVEGTIATAASVSRTPVREALGKLEVDGLVKSTPRGTVVGVFSMDELSDLCSVRETLEGMASQVSATTMSEMEVLSLERVNHAYEEATRTADIRRLVELNHAFHEAIWQGSRNRYLADRLRTLRSQIERIQETTLAIPARREDAMREHAEILQAIREHDQERAERVTRQHFRRAMAMRLAHRRMEASGTGQAVDHAGG
jgi:DNA-binding GntR family transcriptional regulator